MQLQNHSVQPLKELYAVGRANASSVTKMHFIELLYERLGLTRSEAGSVVDGIFEEIEKALVEGKEVKLVNFGTFTPRDKSARPGRNPRNGDEHVVSARRVITFAPSKYLRDRVADFTDPDYEADKDDEKEVA